jgi:hypothetical protein
MTSRPKAHCSAKLAAASGIRLHTSLFREENYVRKVEAIHRKVVICSAFPQDDNGPRTPEQIHISTWT